jgi:hypothetical protein
VLKVEEERLELKELKVLVVQELRAHKVEEGLKELRAHKVQEGLKVLKEHKDQQVEPLKVLKVLKEHKDQQVEPPKELKELKELKVVVEQETQGQEEQQEPKEL